MLISKDVKNILNACDTKKVIATVNEKGIVHVTFKDMLFINTNNDIILFELLERSITNQNLVYSIWFNKTVAINFLCQNSESFHVQALPKRALVSGKEFEKYYQMLLKEMGDIDLSTVWLFDILEIKEKTLSKQMEEHKKSYPIICHLDRLITE